MNAVGGFALPERTALQADLLYNLFPNPVVAKSLLDRRIYTSHRIVMDGPGYRLRKRPNRPTNQTTRNQSG